MNAPSRHVLLVEDSPDDRFLIERALRRACPELVLSSVADGDAAVDYLAGRPPFADRSRYPVPALVLLDWKLARRSGREVLDWIRARPRFDALPVVVLTASAEDEDIREAFAARANSYLAKPGAAADMAAAMARILDYWLGLNLHPRATPDETETP